MPGQQDRHIGREIIGLLMGPVLPAPGASSHRFEEAMKELRIVTTRASASRAAGHRLPTGGWKGKVFAFRILIVRRRNLPDDGAHSEESRVGKGVCKKWRIRWR